MMTNGQTDQPTGVHKQTTSPPMVAGTNIKNGAIYGVLQAHFSK